MGPEGGGHELEVVPELEVAVAGLRRGRVMRWLRVGDGLEDESRVWG